MRRDIYYASHRIALGQGGLQGTNIVKTEPATQPTKTGHLAPLSSRSHVATRTGIPVPASL